MKRNTKRSTARLITLIFLWMVPIIMLLVKDVDFSEKENRYMASLPVASLTTLTDGSFMDDVEDYLTDQFPLRDFWVSVKATTLRALGSNEINNVYICKDNYLIARESEFDKSNLDELIYSIGVMASRVTSVNVDLMLVPNASYVYEEKLPAGVNSGQEDTLAYVKKILSTDVGFIDVSTALKNDFTEQVYYKSDHHWTTRGAYAAFRAYSSQKNIDTTGIGCEFYTATDCFQGSQSSNSGIYSVKDEIELGVPTGWNGSYVVKNVEENSKSTTLFDSGKLSQKDKYQVFMGGNYAEVDITTTNHTGKNLMVIKDSYANCFIPLLTPYYDSIVVIDPRYYYDDLYDCIAMNEITDILLLYNINSFMTDNSLSGVLLGN